MASPKSREVGTMSVTKRCGCKNKNKCGHGWTCRWFRDGRQFERTFKSKAEAVAHGKLMEADKVNGTPAAPKSISFGEYAKLWLDSGPGRTPRTAALYAQQFRLYLIPKFGSRKLSDVADAREEVQAHLRSLSPGNIAPTHTALMSMVGEAVKSGGLTGHRLRGLNLGPDAEPRKRELFFPTRAQLDALAAALPPALALIVAVMAGTGVRPAEALALRKSDFDGGRLRVQRQQLRTPGSTGWLKAKKPGTSRLVPCPQFVTDVISDMPDGDLFHASNRYLYARFKVAAKAAGLPADFTPHALRHVFASTLLGNGAALTDVSSYLGHSSPAITYSVYAHLLPDSLGKAIRTTIHGQNRVKHDMPAA